MMNGPSSSSSNGREVCKYFLHGVCRYGDNCFFLHARTPTQQQYSVSSMNREEGSAGRSGGGNRGESGQQENFNQSQSNICKFYQQGRCIFGNNCFNRHVQTTAALSTVTNDGTSLTVNGDNNGEADNDDEISYENAIAATATASSWPSSSSASSTSSSSSSNSNLDINNSNNSDLVKRSLGSNKPKLRLTSINSQLSLSNNLSAAAQPFEPIKSKEPKTVSNQTTPSSYYEAVTGKPLNYADIDPDSSDLNIFDPAYIEYLRKTKSISSSSTNTQQPPLCPYSELHLPCPFGDSCDFSRHLAICDQCGKHVLDESDREQQQAHRVECMRRIEADMEEAFAVAASRDKLCGICMEVVWEKEPTSERRFGILESCNHIFCLTCIRKWRASKSYENKVVKACPECRVKSDYVTPSSFWFDSDDAKKKIISDYKIKLSKTPCKYFKQGDGTCPFGSKCFYLHQYKDGRLATNLPEPTTRRRFNRDGRLENFANLVHIEFRVSDNEDDSDLEDVEAEFDLFQFIRHNFLWSDPTDTDESDYSDFLDDVLRLV